ncbi:hypothetical protein [Microbacterium sp. GXS0129]|uniref:hypothetical protein n=1 Tax=Microbacterium sp. GXS0129 TaxID=3377836 RepID=UPI00383BA119
MPSYSSLTDHAAVEAAIAEFSSLGRELFLLKYGFPEVNESFVIVGAGRYDTRALFASAYGHQHGEPLTSRQVVAGLTGAAGQLGALGYVVTTPDDLKAADTFPTFDAALARFPIPVENLPVIREFLVNRNYREFFIPASRAYIGAKPRSGKPPHQIGRGYIAYREEDGRPRGIELPVRVSAVVEALSPIRGGASSTRSTEPRAPRAAAEPRAPRVAKVERQDAFCPTCFMVLPATGVCANCD